MFNAIVFAVELELLTIVEAGLFRSLSFRQLDHEDLFEKLVISDWFLLILDEDEVRAVQVPEVQVILQNLLVNPDTLLGPDLE